MDAPRRPVLTAPVRIARSIAGRGLYESVLPMARGFKSKKSQTGTTNVALRVARPVRERRAAIEPVANNQPMVEDPGAPAAHLTPCQRQRWCFCVLSIYIRSGPPRTLLAPHTRAKLAGCTYMILRRRMLFNSLSLTFCKLRGCPTSASGASRGCRLGTIPLVGNTAVIPFRSSKNLCNIRLH